LLYLGDLLVDRGNQLTEKLLTVVKELVLAEENA